jgi:hypothetical protein
MAARRFEASNQPVADLHDLAVVEVAEVAGVEEELQNRPFGWDKDCYLRYLERLQQLGCLWSFEFGGKASVRLEFAEMGRTRSEEMIGRLL